MRVVLVLLVLVKQALLARKTSLPTVTVRAVDFFLTGDGRSLCVCGLLFAGGRRACGRGRRGRFDGGGAEGGGVRGRDEPSPGSRGRQGTERGVYEVRGHVFLHGNHRPEACAVRGGHRALLEAQRRGVSPLIGRPVRRGEAWGADERTVLPADVADGAQRRLVEDDQPPRRGKGGRSARDEGERWAAGLRVG